jgi:hypothetical protein
VFPGLSGFHRLYRTAHTTKTSKEQEEKKAVLLWKEKEAQLRIYTLYTANQKGLLIYKTKRRQRGVESMIIKFTRKTTLNCLKMY